MLKRGSEKLGKKDCAQFTGYSSKKKNIYVYMCACVCVCPQKICKNRITKF